jgi:hypothetical protein
MSELEITWSRLFRIWWLLVWRTCFGILAVVVAGIGLIGLFGYFLDLPSERMGFWFGVFLLIFWPLIIAPVIRMILKKKFRDFRVQLVSPLP